METPLVLTLSLDGDSFSFFDGLRRRYFPPERNFLAAHLTLFHHLPGPALPAIIEHLTAVAARCGPLQLAVTGLLRLGQGVAYAVESGELRALRWQLQQHWWTLLNPQDRQPLRSHVTVQNKVAPEAASALHAELEAGFAPFAAIGTGLQLWAYCGGPWEPVACFGFGGQG